MNGTCVIRPPQAWCIIKPERFYFLANPDTKCVIKLKQSNQQEECNSTVALDSVSTYLIYRPSFISSFQSNYFLIIQPICFLLVFKVKPNQPFNLALTESNGSFNLSWEIVSPELEGELIYKMCLKPKEDLDEVKAFVLFFFYFLEYELNT